MTSRAPNPQLEDHSGECLAPLHVPLHIPGFKAYCPICGIGCDSEHEAAKCCAVLAPAKERRIRTRYERSHG